MKKTKILAVLVCAVFAFVLAACSNSSGGSSDDEKPAKPSKSDTDDEEDDFTWPDFPTGAYTVLPANTTGSAGTGATYVTFGLYPQTKKEDNITVTSSSRNLNGWTVYAGSDNEWYVKHGESGNEKYFKVEPIKWRVLTTDYDHDGDSNTTGKKLLLAENILINCLYYDYYTVDREISSKTVYPNNYEHSRIRAFLNGLSYQKKASDSANQEADATLENKGFFQTAFTTEEQSAIATTRVENNAASTNPDAVQWNSGVNLYASDTPTEDKIFLLSEQEVTKADYGFAAYDAYVGDSNGTTTSTRIRMTTAFANNSGAYQNTTAGYGGYWWTRSPNYGDSYGARTVESNGIVRFNYAVNDDSFGVVPALCLN